MPRVQGNQLAWKEHTPAGAGPGAPLRAVLPVFDQSGPFVGGPALSYKATLGGPAEVIVIKGENLTGITLVDPSHDVQVGGNGGAPPVVVGAPVVTDVDITVTLDCTLCGGGDIWGIILEDAAGNPYEAPSPLKIWAPL